MRELSFEPLPDAAICLRPTGAPGGLALLGEWTRRNSEVALRTATGAGPGAVRLGSLATCATASGPLVAGPVRVGEARYEMRAAVAGSGVPVALGDASFLPTAPAVALAPGAHAVVAWAQHRGSFIGLDDIDMRIVAVRRAADGGFGPVEPLTRWRATDDFTTTVLAGIDDAGTATIAWSQPLVERRDESNGIEAIAAATAAPGRPFAVQRIAPRAEEVSRPALAVAGDGGALLVHGDTVDGPVAFERPPGAAAFARVAVGGESSAEWPAVALRRGGGAVIAWKGVGGDVLAVRRLAGAAFGPVERVAAERRSWGFGVAQAVLTALPSGSRPSDPDNARLRASLGAGGRALLGWADGDPATPQLAAGTLADGFGTPQSLGSPVRDANGVVPLFTADGRAAVAWTDNAGPSVFRDFPTRGGRLHLAVEGAPPAVEPPPPRLTVRGRRTRRLFSGQALTVTARCDRACDVRAQAGGQTEPSGISASRPSAGPLRLRVPVAWLVREGERVGVRVHLRATALGGRRVARAVLRTRVTLRRSLPVPRPIGLRARRTGSRLVVTWRTRRPARRVWFLVDGRRSRRGPPVDAQALEYVRGRGRTRFRLVLRLLDPAAVRWVNVDAHTADTARPRLNHRVRVS